MAANVVTPTPEEWEIISRFLDACEGGALVIHPTAAEKLATLSERERPEPRLDDYDYGGSPEVTLDVVHDDAILTEDRQEIEEELERGGLDMRLEAALEAYGVKPSWK